MFTEAYHLFCGARSDLFKPLSPQQFPRRLAQFGLTLNEDKTLVLQFGRFAAQARAKQGLAKLPTFDFLGIPDICGRSRSNGWF